MYVSPSIIYKVSSLSELISTTGSLHCLLAAYSPLSRSALQPLKRCDDLRWPPSSRLKRRCSSNRRHKVGSKAWFAEISRDSAIVTPFYPVGGWSGSVNQAFPWVYGAGAPVLGCPRETCMKMQTALRSPANFITERNGTASRYR